MTRNFASAAARTMVLAVAQIRIDGGTQMRVAMDDDTVDDYAAHYHAGGSFPPVVVFYDGTHYWLADGFHRVAGAVRGQTPNVAAEVRNGSRRDAVLYAVGANANHGLRRTNADKRNAVLTLLRDDEWAKWNQSKIARQCGVTQQFVSKLRSELSYNCCKIYGPTLVERGGIVYEMDTTAIGGSSTGSVPPPPAALDGASEAEILAAARAILDRQTAERRAERVETIRELSAKATPLTGALGSFPVVYADPPWRYDYAETESRAIENQYPTLDVEEIAALPVASISTDDAVLFCWATSPKLREALRVVDAWGFTYRTCMVWAKDRIGMGYYARQQHELLLIATKGSPPAPTPETRPPSVVHAPRAAHSAKPSEFYELIERMYPDFKRVELFSRSPREGWTAWGNQA